MMKLYKKKLFEKKNQLKKMKKKTWVNPSNSW
jgi:hypothetical protein